MDDARARRTAARAAWPIRKTSLDAEGSADILVDTTPEERLAMMWELAVTAWTMSGHPMPDYQRSSMPGRVVRREP